jgi:GNAT superfamily N-acetyltransferase
MRRLFHELRPEDLRFRFLTGMKEVSAERIHDMTHVDHRSAETYIAFIEGDPIPVATAMLATDAKREQGEVAISVRADHRAEGIGWELLAFVTRQAAAQGLRAIQSIESRDNHDAIVLEREMGFKATPDPDDARLVILSKALC